MYASSSDLIALLPRYSNLQVRKRLSSRNRVRERMESERERMESEGNKGTKTREKARSKYLQVFYLASLSLMIYDQCIWIIKLSSKIFYFK